MKTLEATCYFHQNRIYVKPAEGTYEMIYRAACGVYWDEEEKALYFLDDPTNYQLSLKHIVLAMKNEYYIDLIITNTFMQCDLLGSGDFNHKQPLWISHPESEKNDQL